MAQEEKKDSIVNSSLYPSNSKNPKKKEVQKVISGTAKTVEKSVGQKFSENFLGSKLNDVWHYILHDILIPAAKSMIYDGFTGGLEMGLFGDKGAKNRGNSNRTNYVNYGKVSYGQSSRNNSREDFARDRIKHNFDNILLDSRGEADDVLGHLMDLILDYEMATVADLYDLVGLSPSYVDQRWGWTDLSSAKVVRVREGYLLDLPKTRLLD